MSLGQDLADFLLARIAEDEALLHRDDREPHSAHLTDLVGTHRPDICPTCRGITLLGQRQALADCAAKRKIVEELRTVSAHADTEYDSGRVDAFTASLLLLADVYADHPDYDQAWRP